MKAVPLIALVWVVAAAGCTQPTPDAPTATESNAHAQALRDVHETYLDLAAEVEKRSASLSDAEKKRAAMFLHSAFDLVMETYVFKGDPANPALTDWMTPYRKFGGDNPHTIYTQMPVNHHYTYVLKGKLGNAFYFGVQAYGLQSGFNLPTANTALNDLKLEKDGSFELYLSAQRPANARNWLPIAEGDHAVLLRQYFKGKTNNRGGEFTITRTDTSSYVAFTYLDRLKRAKAMMPEYINGTLEVCDLLRSSALNRYAQADAEVKKPKYGGALYPTRDNRYEGFWVSLQTGQAVHLHGRLPENTPYASYVFYDRWYTTPDYHKVRSYLTNEEIARNPDGTFDLYLSPETVEHPNWINTGGLYEGSYASRYLMSEATDFPEVRVVSIADIPKYVPGTTAR